MKEKKKKEISKSLKRAARIELRLRPTMVIEEKKYKRKEKHKKDYRGDWY